MIEQMDARRPCNKEELTEKQHETLKEEEQFLEQHHHQNITSQFSQDADNAEDALTETKNDIVDKKSVRAGSQDKTVILLNPVLSSMSFKTSPIKASSVTVSTNLNEKSDGQPVSGDRSKDTLIKTESDMGPKSVGKQNADFIKALAAALTSEPKKKVFCANTNCNMKTDMVYDAKPYAKIYFGMKSSGSPKICSACFKKAELYNEKSKLKLINKENLFDLKCEIQTASSEAVVDLDSPVNSPEASFSFDDGARQGGCENSDTDTYQADMEKFDDIINKTLRKFSLALQLDKCTTSIAREVENLGDDFSNMDLELERLRKDIECTTTMYNDNVAAKAKTVEIGSVDMDARGAIRVRQNENIGNIDGISRIGEKALRRAIAELKTIENTVPEMSRSVTSLPTQNTFTMNRRMGKLIFVKPKKGQDVYAMHKHSLFYWLPAKILDIVEGEGNVPTIYRVQFQQRIKPRMKSCNDADTFIKEITGKQLAFKKHSTVTLPVGTRIIGKFKDLLNTDAEVDGMLYAGIIAEIPRDINRNRYLVFFDDGYAQYVDRTEVLPVVESSPEVWQDVHRNSQDFIREYVMQFPNRHMIRAEIGTSFTVELNGQWLVARIVEVDSSLLKMQYLRRADGVEFEWIYRGSTRLGPLYNRLKTLQARPTIKAARRHTYASRRTNFSFEVNRDGEESQDANKVARKHTGCDGAQGAGKSGMIKTKNGFVINTVLESQGNMIKIQIPRECPSPRAYIAHSCSIKCGHRYVEDPYRKVSPLAIPFYLGWARELAGTNRDKVFYHTPCGVRLGAYQEIHTYITRTASRIPIDFFSLEPNIDCLNEFEPLRRIEYLKDISYGKEWTPVTCVNSLDHDLPAYMEYITARIPGKGVKINNDDDFLVCCDCEDDCSDKDKCACWQMTLSGVSFKLAAKEGTELHGYENRRLKNHVLSGIYECNRKCKCRSTCFNRVVQNKVKWPIQMFKTVAKGWGVRALHDMPQGSFICVYTGQLLTDAGANESGIEVGDEYLAELDFIECNEQIKEDYESDCTDIENEEPGSKSTLRLISKTNGEKKVAKKSTVHKALKSTGGIKRKMDDDSGNFSDVSAASMSSSRSGGLATARKSGSKNGAGAKGEKVKHSSSSSVPSPSNVSSDSSSSGAATRTKRSASKGESGESDDDDDIQIYSSFSASMSAKDTKNAPRLPLREYFGKDEAVYIMDAKSMGNFGRYLNHSCDPNVFVQNLFVDTHDPRFPWVAFFTKKDVKAGTELTWDYNYDIGSVPGKTLYCYCLKDNCRGRLL